MSQGQLFEEEAKNYMLTIALARTSWTLRVGSSPRSPTRRRRPFRGPATCVSTCGSRKFSSLPMRLRVTCCSMRRTRHLFAGCRPPAEGPSPLPPALLQGDRCLPTCARGWLGSQAEVALSQGPAPPPPGAAWFPHARGRRATSGSLGRRLIAHAWHARDSQSAAFICISHAFFPDQFPCPSPA